MKKIKMIEMLALAFTLVFGAVSCKNETEEGPWGDSLADVIKEEKSTKFLETAWFTDEDNVESDVTLTIVDKEYDFAEYMGATDDMVSFVGTFGFMPKVEKEDAVAYFSDWVAREAAFKKQYKDGPISTSDGSQYQEAAVMINGDRDAIRIEWYLDMSGKYNGVETSQVGTMTVTYNKKK